MWPSIYNSKLDLGRVSCIVQGLGDIDLVCVSVVAVFVAVVAGFAIIEVVAVGL